MRTIAMVLALAVVLLAGCSTVQPLAEVSASLTTLPMPSGAEVAPSVSGAAVESCDATASLRPSTEPGPTVEAIRRRGRVVVGIDQNNNPLSFRDPVTGELQGFRVDISREVVRDLVGDPDKVDFRLTDGAGAYSRGAKPDRRHPHEGDDDHLSTCGADRLLHGVLRRKPTAAGATGFAGAGAGRPGRQAGLLRAGDDIHRHRRTGRAGGDPCSGFRIWMTAWSRFSRVRRTRPAPTMSLLAGMVVQDPNLEIVGPSLEAEPYGIGVNKSHDDLVRAVNASLERIRRDGTWVALYRKWLTALGPPPSPPEPKYRD